jgi:hypothetical protein
MLLRQLVLCFFMNYLHNTGKAKGKVVPVL